MPLQRCRFRTRVSRVPAFSTTRRVIVALAIAGALGAGQQPTPAERDAYRSRHQRCTEIATDLLRNPDAERLHEIAVAVAETLPREQRPIGYRACREALAEALQSRWAAQDDPARTDARPGHWLLGPDRHGVRLSILFGVLLGGWFARRLRVRRASARRVAAAALTIGGGGLGGAVYLASWILIAIGSWLEEPSQWEVLAFSVVIQAIGAWYLVRLGRGARSVEPVA